LDYTGYEENYKRLAGIEFFVKNWRKRRKREHYLTNKMCFCVCFGMIGLKECLFLGEKWGWFCVGDFLAALILS